jgi:hypothetical protein
MGILGKIKKYSNDVAEITIAKVISLVIIVYVIVAILPDALAQLIGMNTTGSPIADMLLKALAVIIVLVIFAGIAKEAE